MPPNPPASQPVTTTPRGVRITVTAKPRARRSAVHGFRNDALVLALAATPTDGQANDELVAFLARILGVPRSSVAIARGTSSRHKLVDVAGITASDALRRLASAQDQPA